MTVFYREDRNKMFKNLCMQVAPLVRRYLEGSDWTMQWEHAYQLSQQQECPWDGLPMGFKKG